MKKLYTLLTLAIAFQASSRNINADWTGGAGTQKVFIENKGQYATPRRGEEVQFSTEAGPIQVLFSANGLTYMLNKRSTLTPEAREKIERSNKSHQEKERLEHELKGMLDIVKMEWENSNPNATIEGLESTPSYYSFNFGQKNINEAKSFQKIVYKNIYPQIDIEYTFHPQDGLKYTIILHPGADASVVKMKYSDVRKVSTDSKGNIIIPTKFGNITDHAPLTFYQNNEKKTVSSKFVVDGKTVSFLIGEYDHSQTLVIDPWVQTPTLTNPTGVWECERDGSGNAYIIGGGTPMKLMKYNSTGVLQWTYTTPYDTSQGDWLGTLATDLAGNSYVTNGSNAAIQKIGTGGAQVWSVTGGALDEYWTIAFNCDQTKLVVGGTRLSGLTGGGNGMIFDISTTNGSVTATKKVGFNHPYTITIPFFGTQAVTDVDEVRAITSSFNARYYFMTLDTLGSFDQNFSVCPNSTIPKLPHTYSLSYKCENFRPDNGNAGIPAMKANANFLYTQGGSTVHKRSLVTGAIISSATIPGGVSNTVTGTTPLLTNVGNSGIDIDNCGNVYVGSGNAVIKYDANLNLLSSATTSFVVSDVAVSYSGNVIVCGSTGTSSSTSRTGYVQSFNMGGCDPIVLACCDANVCPAGPFCLSDAPTAITPAVTSGTWSGPGVNTSTGVFNPTTAGVGTHTITNTLGCGSGSIDVVVNPCAVLTVCKNANGTLTVSGGTGPYTWARDSAYTDCSGCTFGQCIPGFCNGVAATDHIVYSTATTSPAPLSFPITVTDAAGSSVQVTSLASLQNCSNSCAITLNATAASTTCGQNNGSVNVTVVSGTGPYTYAWSPGGATSAAVSNLAAGTYTVTVTGANNCTQTATVTVATSVGIAANATSTNASCGQSNGSATVNVTAGPGSYTYSWSPSGGTSATAPNLAPGTYTVTVTGAGNCTQTATATVGTSAAIVANATSTATTCGNNNGTATVNVTAGPGSYTYVWSPGGAVSASISDLAAGTYTVAITGAGGCTGTATTTIASSIAITTTSSSTNAGCGNPTGTATVNVTAGTGGFTYVWLPGNQTGATATALSGGTYTVTVTGAGGCTATNTATVAETGGITANVTSTDASCSGGDGTATATVTAGPGGYTYLWSPGGATTAAVSNLAVGSYTVTISGTGGCSFTASATIGVAGTLPVTVNSVNTTCGNANGTATAVATGTGLTYAWAPGGETTSAISGLSGGTYTVTVTSGGCTGTATASIASSTPITATITSINASCGGSGSATVVASGGSGYTYVWSPSGGSSATATGLAPGTYTVTVNATGGCTTNQTATIGQDGGLNATVTTTNAGCSGNNGSATVIPIGGSGYTYSWSPSGGTASTATGLAPGTYTVTVSTIGGCTTTQTAIVGQVGGITATATTTNATCRKGSDGAINTVVTGGSSPYIFNWSNSLQTQNLTGLTAGTYTCTITDQVGCSTTLTANVSQPADSVTVAATVSGNVLTATTLGATGTVSYQWYMQGVSGNPDVPIQGATSSTYTYSASGTYYVIVVDSKGCTARSPGLELTKAGGVNEEALYGLMIFPNPAFDILSVQGGNFIGKTLTAEMYAANGQLVFKKVIESGNFLKFSIPLNDFSEGLYLLKLSSGEDKRVEHIMVKR